MKKREKEDEIYLKQMGKRIRQMRKEKGMKQAELGYACDIEKQSMYRIEAGRTNPTIITLKRIAEQLGISLNELFEF